MLGIPGLTDHEHGHRALLELLLERGVFDGGGAGRVGNRVLSGREALLREGLACARLVGQGLDVPLVGPRTFQMRELATKTSTADPTIGVQSPASVSTATSLWIGTVHPRSRRPHGQRESGQARGR